jgi:hypothetical protein
MHPASLLSIRRRRPVDPCSAGHNRGRHLVQRHAVVLTFLVAPAMALAQAAAGDAGVTLWGAFRSVLYGPWGLVGSAIIVGIGIYMFLERGFMHALGVMAAGALIFFVPLIVVSMRNAAQALGGAG